MRTRHHRPANRRGFALAVALFALVVIGALIAGVFFASTQEFRVGRNTLTQQRAFAMAEYGLNGTVNNWTANSNRYRGMAYGATDSSGSFTVDGSVARVKVTRLNMMSWWVTSEGVAGGDAMTESRRKTSGVVRLQIPAIDFLGALTLRGTARIGGSSQINGNDQNPTGWAACPPASGGMPGVVVDSLNHITYSGGAWSVTGNPSGVAADPAARDTSTYFRYGDMEWADLVRMATIRVPDGTSYSRIAPESITTTVSGISTSRCNSNPFTNWGQVTRTTPTAGVCEGYFPIIYAQGDLSLSGGSGQGILLVEEDLQVQGGFEFFGPVIVRGTLRTSGTGGHFNGGVMAANVNLDASVVLGDAIVNYSSCAVNQALMGSAAPQWVRDRAWSELF